MEHRKLRVAAIMDEFTYYCYSPECDILQITPDNFKQEIDGHNPDFLFIESVWRGKDNLWRYKLHDNMEDITALTDYCREKNIPIVFWSKEDPVHFGVFILTAALADYVFTTDADSVELYKARLGHDRVYYLPFGAQPKTHNPVEEYDRKDKFCFAGSFYVKYKERAKVFIDLAPFFKEKGLDIYDRNFKKGESDNNSQSTSVASPQVQNYYFPDELRECILGGLPYSEISKAYKGYKYGINMTSMVQSGYMFARRVFELLASNTVTVSNYSRGLELFFGDLIAATNDAETMREKLNKFCGDELSYRKYRLAGLRHVLAKHLYEDRLDRVARIVLNTGIKRPLPKILAVCRTKSDSVVKAFESQSYENKMLVEAGGKTVDDFEFDFVTVFDENDYYGKNYLTDFALATRFASDGVIGKCAYYSHGEVKNIEKAYTRQKENADLSRQMIQKDLLKKGTELNDLFDFDECLDILSLDEFNYCENAAECEEADDIEVYTGVDIEKIYESTDKIKPVKMIKSSPFDLKDLFEQVRIEENDKVKKSFADGKITLVRDVDDDEIVWLRTDKNYPLDKYTKGNRVGFFTKVSCIEGNVRCQIEYYDKDNIKLGFLNFALDGSSLLRVFDGATSFKLIFRMRGNASVVLDLMNTFSFDSLLPAPFVSKDTVLITENYPSYSQPDKSAREHIFAKEHKAEVLKVDTLPSYIPYSEYDSVHIVSVQYEAVEEYLSACGGKKVYVSSPSDKLKEILKNYSERVVEI